MLWALSMGFRARNHWWVIPFSRGGKSTAWQWRIQPLSVALEAPPVRLQGRSPCELSIFDFLSLVQDQWNTLSCYILHGLYNIPYYPGDKAVALAMEYKRQLYKAMALSCYKARGDLVSETRPWPYKRGITVIDLIFGVFSRFLNSFSWFFQVFVSL